MMEDSLKTLENAAKLAGEKALIRFTRFLDPAQAVQAERVSRKYGACFSAWGGFDRAERVVGCFHPAGDDPAPQDFPLVCLHSRHANKFSALTHRDLLGSFMSLGLTRDCIGDIIILGENIYLFAEANTASYISQSMTSAGRTSLHFKTLDQIPVMPEPEGTRFSAVVSSLRLDAVLAAAYHLSRSESAEMIRAGIVKVNHLVCDRVDASLAADTLLSVRGRGRVRLVSVDGTTRKQRIGITLFRYE